MSQAHLTAFLADIRTINTGININDRFGTRTSLAGLIAHLQRTVDNPRQMTALQARQHCTNPRDARIDKYLPALKRLVSVWGRGAHRRYPQAAGFVFVMDHLYGRARTRFDTAKNLAPSPLRPAWADLERFDDNPAAFGMSLGNTFLHRVMTAAGRVDITSRSLLLKAGLTPPVATGHDNGYIARLELAQPELDAMRDRAILDVGCGAAMFRAEMEELYGCTSTGIDLNHAHIPGAVNNAKARYVKSMLYLKMMNDLGVLSKTSVPPWTLALMEQLIQHMDGTVTKFGNNLPQNGNVFDLFTAQQNYRGGRPWNFCVSMFLLCYFDADQQTDAILNMCAVTTTAIFLHNGRGAVPTSELIYDQAAIRGAYPRSRIVVKNPQTHHIYLR